MESVKVRVRTPSGIQRVEIRDAPHVTSLEAQLRQIDPTLGQFTLLSGHPPQPLPTDAVLKSGDLITVDELSGGTHTEPPTTADMTSAAGHDTRTSAEEREPAAEEESPVAVHTHQPLSALNARCNCR